MVIDVALFLDLADDRTPAATAGDQARKGKIMLDAAVLLGVPAIQKALNAFPQIAGDQWLVPTHHPTQSIRDGHAEPASQRDGRAHQAAPERIVAGNFGAFLPSAPATLR
jgi:hypothetical protein